MTPMNRPDQNKPEQNVTETAEVKEVGGMKVLQINRLQTVNITKEQVDKQIQAMEAQIEALQAKVEELKKHQENLK